jgi:hypothetical protein
VATFNVIVVPLIVAVDIVCVVPLYVSVKFDAVVEVPLNDLLAVKRMLPAASVSALVIVGGKINPDAPGPQKFPVRTNIVIQRIVVLKYPSLSDKFATLV